MCQGILAWLAEFNFNNLKEKKRFIAYNIRCKVTKLREKWHDHKLQVTYVIIMSRWNTTRYRDTDDEAYKTRCNTRCNTYVKKRGACPEHQNTNHYSTAFSHRSKAGMLTLTTFCYKLCYTPPSTSRVCHITNCVSEERGVAVCAKNTNHYSTASQQTKRYIVLLWMLTRYKLC